MFISASLAVPRLTARGGVAFRYRFGRKKANQSNAAASEVTLQA